MEQRAAQQRIIEVTPRTTIGSSEARRARKSGIIPSTIYSHGTPSVSVSLSERAFLKVAKVSKSSQIFILKSEDSKINGKNAVVKAVQKDHLTNRVLHVDFQAIREDEEITVRVPLKVVGEAPGVKLDGGILTVVAHEVAVRCLPKYIPSEVSVDVSELRISQSIHAQKLQLDEHVKLAGNPGETIVAVVALRAVEEEAASAATPAEGAAAPAEGAAAPAAGATPAAAPAAEAAKKDAKK